MKKIESKAPGRVDLAGGTLDIWPLYLLHENSVTVNLAVNLYSRVVLEKLQGQEIVIESVDRKIRQEYASLDDLASSVREGKSDLLLPERIIEYFAPESGLSVQLNSEIPFGAGLSGSSAMNVALCGAMMKLKGVDIDKSRVVQVARDLEARVLGVPTGMQDYYASVYGGVNTIHWEVFEPVVEQHFSILETVEKRMLLVNSGVSHNSGANNWDMFKKRIDGDGTVSTSMKNIQLTSHRLHLALKNKDLERVGKFLNEEWKNRRELSETVSSPEIEAIISKGIGSGATGGKVCGAGGGGVVVLWVDAGCRPECEKVLSEAGYDVLASKICSKGLVVREI